MGLEAGMGMESGEGVEAGEGMEKGKARGGVLCGPGVLDICLAQMGAVSIASHPVSGSWWSQSCPRWSLGLPEDSCSLRLTYFPCITPAFRSVWPS